MPPPAVPSQVDGHPLSPEARALLKRLLDLIWAETPTRDLKDVLFHALSSFRLAAEVQDGRWEQLPGFRLGDGSGPFVDLLDPNG